MRIQKRIRSRNAFIDAALEEMGTRAHDAYADLEDFIVCKPGKRYHFTDDPQWSMQ